jgi:hypothetical protein
MLQRLLLLPIIPLVFAYLELGGNWFGYKLLQGGVSAWSAMGTIVFSVLYSLVAAWVALKLQVDLGLLMVNYGFGFSIVAIFLKLEWGKIPSFSSALLTQYPLLSIVAIVSLIGFFISGYLVVTSYPTT